MKKNPHNRNEATSVYGVRREIPTIARLFSIVENNKEHIHDVFHINSGFLCEEDYGKSTLIYSSKNGWYIDHTCDKDLLPLFNFKELANEIASNRHYQLLWNVSPHEIDKVTFDFLPQTYVFLTYIPFSNLNFKP